MVQRKKERDNREAIPQTEEAPPVFFSSSLGGGPAPAELKVCAVLMGMKRKINLIFRNE